jgi:hypothetical protein
MNAPTWAALAELPAILSSRQLPQEETLTVEYQAVLIACLAAVHRWY